MDAPLAILKQVTRQNGRDTYYIKVSDYSFSFSGQSFLINGRSAVLPSLIEENEKNHQLTLLAERSNRFYIYLHQTESV